MQSADLATDNIEKLGKLFPNCITESIGDKGEVIKAIDFDLLRQEFSDSVVEGPRERYHLNWPGKQESLITANTSINKTLRPCHEESVDFDSTKNLFIEGENLDALKLLQETYLGKVKMIYIDPPYNTGKDFIYSDKFKKDKGEYEEESGQVDEEGNRLVANTESKGRFHSDWLSMMYPRLKLARNLLKDDGVIFVSIDDNEVHNLRKICNEVFGEENFIADLTVVNNLKGRNDKKYIATANERLLMFVKSYEFEECGLAMPESRIAEFKEEDSNGKFRFLGLRKRGGADTREQRPKMYFPIYANQNTGNVSLEKNDEYNIEILPKKSDMSEGCWRWGKSTVLHRIGTLLAKPVGSDGRLGKSVV